MNTQQEHEQPRREGFGGRVRRFIDSELNRVVDRPDPTPDSTAETPASTATVEEPVSTAEAPASTATVEQPVSTAEAPASTATVEEPVSTAEAPASTATVEQPVSTAEAPASTAPVEQPVSTAEAPASTATVEQPVSTAEAPASTAPVEETAPPHTGERRVEQAAADGSAQRVGLLNDPAGLRDQWQQVQVTFVDDPQQAVHEASVLVDRTLREIHENVSRGQISDPTSTEDLRVSFQRYREFFQRLLSA